MGCCRLPRRISAHPPNKQHNKCELGEALEEINSFSITYQQCNSDWVGSQHNSHEAVDVQFMGGKIRSVPQKEEESRGLARVGENPYFILVHTWMNKWRRWLMFHRRHLL